MATPLQTEDLTTYTGLDQSENAARRAYDWEIKVKSVFPPEAGAPTGDLTPIAGPQASYQLLRIHIRSCSLLIHRCAVMAHIAPAGTTFCNLLRKNFFTYFCV
jgi:hypothetical protein